MKFDKTSTILLIAFLIVPMLASTQVKLSEQPDYEVNVNYPPLSITKQQLNEANTIANINKFFKPSWIREYISVEILTTQNGMTKKGISKSDFFSHEQKDNMAKADVGTDIQIKVQYMPENTLKHNDAKEFKFSFLVNPEIEAQFPGGQQQLKQYLNEHAINKIPAGSFENYDLATIKFSINENGKIVDAHAFWPFKDEMIDNLLLEAIQNMPNWNPAEYANGVKVKQELVLSVGNMANCMLPTLNLRREVNSD